ncbi:hypothetical protein SAMN04488134_104205 [Amphibacillus marinus]|uniref:Uncharacterized protein n=1 Tax=Amphibacillus marinus TaxID=872970 RepID=A0A1H8MLG9_9BACI|nr:DUF5696 domain-containing protein [Amphibacillus marinus]SEO18291.1 hypothetical protein SAMN04488134_104205 [Amphibacillus marinus]
MDRSIKLLSQLSYICLFTSTLLFPISLHAVGGGGDAFDPNAELDFSEEVIDPTELDLDDREYDLQDPIVISDLEQVADNGQLALYIDRETATFAVQEKKTDYVWYSNPNDRVNDRIAQGENAQLLNALLYLDYYNLVGQTTRMNSYQDSVLKEQVDIDLIEDGVKITFTFGEASKGIEQIPKYMSRERFETIILDNIEDERAREDFKSRFRFIEEEDSYERRDASFSVVILERSLQTLAAAGYTEADLAYDREQYEEELEESEHTFFVIPLVIKLDGADLLVEIDGRELEYSEQNPLAMIHLLPFFGAANARHEGYMFVPDGSGALIDLNNQKTNYQPFRIPIYGEDEAVFNRTEGAITETARLPVFGMKQDDHAFLAIIESGDAIASVYADVAYRLNEYNNVYSVFTIKESGQLTLSGGDRSSTVSIFQGGTYDQAMALRYRFAVNDSASYVGMAKLYQDYLINRYQLEPIATTQTVPFYLDLSGAIWKRETFLGVPYRSLQPLTTFEEAEQIVQALLDYDITDLTVRYSGWFNGGIDHKRPNRIQVDRPIGGRAGFTDFGQFLQDNQVNFYPDVALLNVHQNSLGFRPSQAASRFITRRIAEVYPFNMASSRRDRENQTPYYVLSPRQLPDHVHAFLQAYDQFQQTGLSLRDLGNYVNSDFREKQVINREQAKQTIIEQYQQIAEEVPSLLTIGGNAFALPYTNVILEAPLTSSGFNITDQSVPFYQMVIRGYANYAGTPLNLAVNQQLDEQLLQLLETGASPYFSWFYQDGATVKDTEFDYLFSAQYQLWLDDAVALYHELNDVLSEVSASPITDHQVLAEQVVKTTYADQLAVIVNYNDWPVDVEGMTVDALSFHVVRGDR